MIPEDKNDQNKLDADKNDQDKLEVDSLKNDLEQLQKMYNELKKEYSENFIIQSMDDMKKRYDRLLQTSVPNHKYSLLNEKYTQMIKKVSACVFLIENVSKVTRGLHDLAYNFADKQKMVRLETELIIIKELLEEN